MIPIKNYTWECECGYMTQSDLEPKECPECFNVHTFTKTDGDEEEEFEDEA